MLKYGDKVQFSKSGARGAIGYVRGVKPGKVLVQWKPNDVQWVREENLVKMENDRRYSMQNEIMASELVDIAKSLVSGESASKEDEGYDYYTWKLLDDVKKGHNPSPYQIPEEEWKLKIIRDEGYLSFDVYSKYFHSPSWFARFHKDRTGKFEFTEKGIRDLQYHIHNRGKELFDLSRRASIL